MSTSYFANCIGVFQGGGVRGAAFAGAYEAAREAGVAFSAVAGASAGSLAAALVATGAPPSLVTKKLMEVDLKRFLTDVDPRHAFVSPVHPWRWSGWMLPGLLRKLSTLASFGGLHSSAEVHSWLDATLRELLESQGQIINDAQVRFRHLPIPLAIVATDLARNSYTVFSRDQTPEVSVGAAARASCSIPFFFQPVLEGGAAYVDGGVLANLPAFMFDASDGSDFGKYTPRLLAFRLVSNATRGKGITSLVELAQSLASTIVDGATDVQEALQPGRHSIAIDTGTINATDFDTVGDKEKKFLFQAGKRATEEFIKNERNLFAERRAPTTFVGRDQQMLLLVQALSEAREHLIILDNTSAWLYLTFPAFLAAARRGVRITYLAGQQGAQNASFKRHEAYRQRLLAGIGADVLKRAALPFRGFLVDPHDDTGFAALTHSQPSTTSYDVVFQSEETRTYSRRFDPEVFQSLLKDSNGFSIESARAPCPHLEFVPCDEEKLFRRLNAVPQYQGAKFTIEEVPLDANVRATQIYVKEFKCLQIDALTRDFATCGVDLFDAQQVELNGGMSTIVTPPVLERHGTLLTMIEGHTRALHCLRNARASVRAVVVDGVTAALPSRPRPLIELTIASKTLSRNAQYENLAHADWRHIEEHVHSVADGE